MIEKIVHDVIYEELVFLKTNLDEKIERRTRDSVIMAGFHVRFHIHTFLDEVTFSINDHAIIK